MARRTTRSYGDQWSLPKIGWDNVFGTVVAERLAPSSPSSTPASTARIPTSPASVVAGTSILDGSDGLSDPNGHGTAMAGIVAAATDNGTGIAGVGYAGVKVMPVTVLGADGTGQDSDIIEGVVWAADHGADVILMAFSNPGYSELAPGRDRLRVGRAASCSSPRPATTARRPRTFPAGDRGVIGVSNTDQTDALNAVVQLRRRTRSSAPPGPGS